MTPFMQVRIKRGETYYSMDECTALCARAGDMDYGDPMAVVTPSGDILLLEKCHLTDHHGNLISTDDIDWDDETEEGLDEDEPLKDYHFDIKVNVAATVRANSPESARADLETRIEGAVFMNLHTGEDFSTVIGKPEICDITDPE